jgi:alcohol dehydrogenase class IV
MGVADSQDNTEQANQKLLSELHALNDELKVPTPSQFGIDQDQFLSLLEEMATQALNSGSPGNNPRVPNKDEIIAIYKTLWN